MKSSLRWLACLVALAAVLLGSFSALAQRGRPGGGFGGFGGPGGGSPVGVLQQPSNVEELKLTDEQKEKITELGEKLREDTHVREIFSKMRGASDEERTALQAEIAKAMEAQRVQADAEIKKLLSAEQYARFRQLALQTRGTGAIGEADVAGELKLSSEQIAKLKAIGEENDKRRSEAMETLRKSGVRGEDMRTKFDELRTEFEEKRLAVLTDAQRKQWDSLRGPELTAEADPSKSTTSKTDSTKSDSKTGGGPRFTRRSQSGAGAGADAAASQLEGDVKSSRTPVVSFGKRADEVVAAKSATDKSADTEKAGSEAQAPKLSFNFRFAPWADVLKTFAELSGLTLDLDVIPPGTFNYFDEKEYTPTEALDVINGYLLQKGYLLVRRDQFLVVLNIDDGIPPNLVPNVTVEELPQRGKNELMNVVLPIEGITADEAAEEVKELVGPQGSVVALKKANAISVTDIGMNLRRIHRLLVGLNAAPADISFKSFDLQHIEATAAEHTVRELFGLPTRGIESVSDGVASRYRGENRDPRDDRSRPPVPTTSSKSKVQVAIDERTNRLLVTAPTAEMKIIDETLKAIDVADEPGTVRKPRSREPYLEVYTVKSADAMEVAKTLNSLYPGCVVNEDGRARRLHIHATPAQHELIGRTIKQLDGEGGGNVSVAVIPTGRMDALTAATTLHSLFAAEKDAAPSIQPHPTSSALIVRGTADQVTQIKLLLTQLDPNALLGDRPKGTLRSVPLGGRDADEFSALLKQFWSTRHANPLIVIPSETNSIRDLRVPSATPNVGDKPRPNVGRTANPNGRIQKPSSEVPATEASPRDSLPKDSSEAKPAPAPKPRAANADSSKRQPATSKSPRIEDPKFEPRAATNLSTIHARVFLASQSASPADSEDAQPATQKPAVKKNARPAEIDSTESAPAEKNLPATDEATDGESAPILIVPSGGNLLLKSDDEAALDELEKLIELMQAAAPSKPRWTVFYLRSADAAETAAMLERLFPTSSVTSTVGGSGGMLGELTSGIGSMGRTMMNATGLNTLGTSPLALRIVPEVRSNALYVSGPADQVKEVEMTLKVLDASELPDQLRDRAPHFIEVQPADVEEVAAIVREVYKDDLAPEGQQPGQQANPFAMFMGQGGNSNRGNNRGGQQPRSIKLTLGVDTRTNTLIVSASETLFRQIEALVFSLDDAAREAKRTVRVVDLGGKNAALVQQTLGAMYSKVKISSSGKSRSSSGSPSSGSSSAPPSSTGSTPPSMPFSPFGAGAPPSDDMRRFFEQRMRERGGGGGSSPPSGR